MLQKVLEYLGVNDAAAFAGTLGAAFAAYRVQAVAFGLRIVYFGIGVSCALWGAPFVVWVFSLPAQPATYSAIGFSLGYFGLTLLDAVNDFLIAVRATNWRSTIDAIIKRWTGGGDKG